MKLLIVLLATVALASAGRFNLRDASNSRSASSTMVELIEGMRDQMPCGSEKYGIPPLAPLKIEQKNVAVATETMSVAGQVNKARIAGLNEFEIVDLKVNVILSKVTFNFNWASVSVKGLYDLEAILKSYGFTVDIKGAGDMFVDVKDINVKGTIKYSLGLVSSQIKLKEMKIVVSLGEVDSDINGILGEGFINRKMNDIIEEFILLAINDNQAYITDTIEQAVLPTVNTAVDGMSLADLIIAAGGGSGAEPTVCIPPVDEEA